VAVSQNYRTPLDMAQRRWGGAVRERTRITASGYVSHGYEWSIRTKAAYNFIMEIKPLMIIPYKIRQVERALKILEIPWERRFIGKTKT
jgi:hypothetical protein